MKFSKQLALATAVTVVGLAYASSLLSAQAAKAPRVFFVEPKDGATVTSPLHMKFGVEGYEISPVPAGDIKTARPKVGHYHVGIDQTCLPSETVIVKGTPSWVHFGDGKAEFDTQLTPGKHTLALQIGDDLHKTVPGLCSTITVTVK